jgi:hypothetical protein
MQGSPQDMGRGRKGALVSGVVLAAMAVGIYLVVVLKFLVQA